MRRKTPLYRFYVDGTTYTAQGRRTAAANSILVIVHLDYPREREIGRVYVERQDHERAKDAVMRGAKSIANPTNTTWL